jgi:hypothetical protein
LKVTTKNTKLLLSNGTIFCFRHKNPPDFYATAAPQGFFRHKLDLSGTIYQGYVEAQRSRGTDYQRSAIEERSS